MKNRPQALSHKDWKNIMVLPEVIEICGLDGTDTVQSFSERVFGVKFDDDDTASGEHREFYIITSGPGYGMSMRIQHGGDRFHVEDWTK